MKKIEDNNDKIVKKLKDNNLKFKKEINDLKNENKNINDDYSKFKIKYFEDTENLKAHIERLEKELKTLTEKYIIKKINSNKKGKNCKSDKKGNPFNFCEMALGLMTKEKLELSGIINEENEEITTKDKCQSKTRETSYKKDDIKNNLFHKNKTIVQSKIIESKVINSEKSSLISLLSGLIK
jgi:hypothetical protein